ncbi:MAG: nucleotide sugar dehydrogenase [Anaerolineales bacterium]
MQTKMKALISARKAKIGVVGIGYVGLPVAALLARAGFQVTGVDVRDDLVAAVNAGEVLMEGDEPCLADYVAEAVASGRLKASTDYAALADAEVVLIAVETPVDDTHQPRYKALRQACRSLGAVMQPGALVIVESTIAPGTMETVVKPLLEEASGKRVSQDFYLVACPERVMPGKLVERLESMSRVVGGMSPEAAELAVILYRHIVHKDSDLDMTDAITAEIVKTAENTYRDVQIAYANELALICENLGADVWEVRELVNKSPGRNVHFPGAGVGGHCIPKDPWLLISNVKDGLQPRLIPTARAVNDHMPLHMVALLRKGLEAEGRKLAGARIAVLGYAYLENTDDVRNSPTAALLAELQRQGAEPRVHDPFVAEFTGDVNQVIEGSDAVVLMVAHDGYRELELSSLRALVRTPVLIDGRNVFDAQQALDAGLRFYKVGVGER